MFPIRIVVIADDITGALDTGIQFSKANVSVQVIVNWDIDYGSLRINEKTSVLVVNSQSRHLPCAEASACVGAIVTGLGSWRPDLYYKKTDSVLRGNIGGELDALMRAAGEEKAVFAPAFPRIGRVTREGVQYVDGSPVSETGFGRDPFDPVFHSFIPDKLREQSERESRLVRAADAGGAELSGKGVYVFDAENDAQLKAAAVRAKENGIRVLAGCAGFAAILPEVFDFPREKRGLCGVPANVTAISGTMNPVTIRQFQYARETGMKVFSMKNTQICQRNYFLTEEGSGLIAQLGAYARTNGSIVIEAADSMLRREEIDSSDEVRETVSDNIGRLAAILFREQPEAALFVTGGDILISALRHLRCAAIEPLAEIVSGVVLSSVSLDGRKRFIISKSGGFGPEDLIPRMITYLKTQSAMRGEE